MLIFSIPAQHSAQVAAPAAQVAAPAPVSDGITASINFPATARVATSIADAINAITKSYEYLPFVTIATGTALISAYALFKIYPEKDPRNRTNRDWAIPAGGLAGSLAFLAILRYR